jgi:hypothetical protein
MLVFGRLRLLSLAAVAVAVAAAVPRPASAIPYFAHEYGMVCQKCHSVIPRLNAFGLAFRSHGFALPGAKPERAFPIATKINLAYTSEPDPTGLPKATVDEIELFLAGRIAPRTNYFVEQYLLDGGRHGATREAWLAYRATPDDARIPLVLTAGSFTLPVPVDPESFRETAQHYSVFDQTVGGNPFSFFDPKIGLAARIGDDLRGTSVTLLGLQGHDKQSGIPSLGFDTMAVAQHTLGPVTLAAYRYDGSRPLEPVVDRFWRQGYALAYASERWAADVLLQRGRDAQLDGTSGAAESSGGFAQLRYAFDRRWFALVRYEGTNDSLGAFARDLVPLVGYRVSRNARFTVEDVIEHVPATKHTLNAQYTVGY